MWRDVFLNNKDAVLEMLRSSFRRIRTGAATRYLRHSKGDELEALFSRTRAIRRSIVEQGRMTTPQTLGASTEIQLLSAFIAAITRASISSRGRPAGIADEIGDCSRIAYLLVTRAGCRRSTKLHHWQPDQSVKSGKARLQWTGLAMRDCVFFADPTLGRPAARIAFPQITIARSAEEPASRSTAIMP